MTNTDMIDTCKHVDKMCTCCWYPKKCKHGYCIDCGMWGWTINDLRNTLKDYVEHTMAGL